MPNFAKIMLNVLNTESRKNSGIIFHLMRAVAGVEIVAKSYVDSLFTHDLERAVNWGRLRQMLR